MLRAKMKPFPPFYCLLLFPPSYFSRAFSLPPTNLSTVSSPSFLHPLYLSLKWHRKCSSGIAPELSPSQTLMVRSSQSGVAPADLVRRMRSCFCVTIVMLATTLSASALFCHVSHLAPGSALHAPPVPHLARKPLKVC